jgi:hypothetical protein
LQGGAERLFSKGLAANRWPESLLDPLRRLLDHLATSILCWSLLVAGCIAIIVTPTGKSPAVICLYLPMLTLHHLRYTVVVPRNP